MEPIIKIIKTNYAKMFRRPLYRFFLFLLSLPVSLIAYVIYRKEKDTNSYARLKKESEAEFSKTEEAALLKAEVEVQLRNKLKFIGKTYDESKFKAEAESIYAARADEILSERFRSNPQTSGLTESTYVGTFSNLLSKPWFLILTVLLGWPMLILNLIYSNAYAKYIMERTLMMVFVIFGVTFLVFSILYMSPMDAATNILGPTATPEQIVSFDETYGLNKPFVTQLLNTFKGLITFDMGKSYTGNEDVMTAIMRKFPVTMQLTIYSLILSVSIAIPIGIISAIKQYTMADYGFMFLALLGLSIPNFWMGYLMILQFSVNNKWLPGLFDVNNWKSLIMPAIVLGTSLAATVTRMTRSSLLEVIKQDYIVTAKAKGLSGSKVILRHALPNAMIPIVTVIGLQFGGMLGGSAVTEKVFNVNGVGKFIVDKQFVPDTPIVLAGVVYVALIISFVNLFVDILYAFLDPRIKSKLKSY